MSEMSPQSSSEVTGSVYERCDAAYLRQLQEAAGMDETQLARIACLSVAQVRQLAQGGDSLFYSQAVKRQAYKRLLLILGAPAPSQIEPSVHEDQPAQDVRPAQTIDDIVALSERNQYLEHRPLVDFFHDLRLRLVQARQPLAALALLLLAVLLLVLNWPNDEAASPKAQVENTPAAPPPSAPSAASAVSVSPPAPEPARPEAAEVKTPASPPAEPADKAPVIAASPSAKTCAYKTEKLPEVVPLEANKEGRYVYMVSPIQTEVCVVDANRQASTLVLRPGEGRSVYGSAPWQISGSDLGKVQVFFQGWRVSLPEHSAQGVTLIEKPR